MALTLPPLPPPGPAQGDVVAAIRPGSGVTVDSPGPDLVRDLAVSAEALRVVVGGIRTGLLTLDQAVSALVTAASTGMSPDISAALAGKADTATVTELQNALTAVTGSLAGKVNTTTYNAKVAALEAADTAQTTATGAKYTKPAGGIPEADLAQAIRDKLAAIGAGGSGASTIEGVTGLPAALAARPTTTDADARYATPTTVAAAVADRVRVGGDLAGTPAAPTVPGLATKLDLSSVRISADDPGVLEFDVLTSAPVVTVPVDPTPVPPVVTNPGTAIDALLPHPYYTPRAYTLLVDGTNTTIADPYQPFAGDRPPSKGGKPIGRMAAPSLYGWPDETNTGVPAGTVLRPLYGEIRINDTSVQVGATTYARPATGAAAVTVGPLTLYPLANPVTLAESVLPVHTVIDAAQTNNTIIRTGNTNTLIRRSLLDAGTRRAGTSENTGYGFLTVVDSRIHGGNNAEASHGAGGRYHFLRCNITGGADVLQPRSIGCYVDFCYLHGTRIVETRHQDAMQIATSHLEPALAARFGGWNIRIRRCTAFSYGEKVGSQWLQFGDITADVRNVLVQDMLGFGGQYVYGFGLGDYYAGYGNNADGSPVTKMSGLTGVPETHAWVRNIFLDRHYLGRKVVDGFPGGGGTTRAVPRYGVTASKRSSAHFVGGLYGDPPPVSMREIRWDDTDEVAFGDIGRTDWPAAATAEGLDFTRYTTGA